MERKPGYRPIDCDFHDRLEEMATLRRRVRLSLSSPEKDSAQDGKDASGGEVTRVGRIEDIYTTETKEEFVLLDDGSAIRLDMIVSVDEAP